MPLQPDTLGNPPNLQDKVEDLQAPVSSEQTELKKQMEDLKRRTTDFNNVVSKLREKNLPKAGKLEERVVNFRGKLDQNLAKHIEKFNPTSTTLSIEQYLTSFFESELEAMIQEAVKEEIGKTGKREVKNVVVLAKSIAQSIKDKPEEQREHFVQEAVEKATEERPVEEQEIDKAFAVVKADKELDETDSLLVRGTLTEIASSDPILAGYIRTLGVENITIQRKDVLVALLSKLNETDKDKAEKIISALGLSVEDRTIILQELDEEEVVVEEETTSNEEPETETRKYDKKDDEKDEQAQRIKRLLEEIGVPHPLVAETKDIRAYVDRRRTQIAEAVESFDYISIKAREEELTKYLAKLIYITPAGSILNPAEVDNAFKLFNLNAPEDANEAILRNLQESRYIREAYIELINERNKKAIPVKKAEYSGIFKAVQRINENRAEGEKIEYENLLEISDIESDPTEVTDSMYKQYEDLVDQLTDDEMTIVFEERNTAIIDHLLTVVSEGEEPEFSQTLRSLLVDKNGNYDPSKVTLTNVSGNSCLTFSSEAILAYVAKLDGVEVVTDEDGNREARYTQEYLQSLSNEELTRNAIQVEGLAHKKENLIMTFDSASANFTKRHEAGHKESSDAVEVRKQLQNKMVAFKMVDAFLKHTEPDLYLKLQQSSIGKITQETKTLSKIVASALTRGGTEELLTALGNDRLATELGVDTSELTPRLLEQAQQLLKVLDYSFQNNDRKGDEDFIANLHNEVEELMSSENFAAVPQQQLMYLLGKLKDLRIYQEKKNKFIDDTDYSVNNTRVTELYTQMQDHFSQEELLTLWSLGYNPEKFNARYDDPDQDTLELGVRGELNENAIESLTMVRLLNQIAVENKELPEGLLEAWKNRIIKYDQFNTSNTLKFIFDLVSADSGYDLNLPGGDQTREELESILAEAKDGGELTAYYEDGLQKESNALRAFAIKTLKIRAKEFDWTQEELQDQLDNIDETLHKVFNIYAALLTKGFEPTDDEHGSERIVSTDKYDLSEPVDIRSQVALLNNEGYINYYFSQDEAPIPLIGGLIAEPMKRLGLAPKDLAEIGLHDVRQRNRNKLLPFGLGETKRGGRFADSIGLIKETPEVWRKRLGADTVTRMEMKSIYDVMWNQTIEAMVKEAQIQQYHAMLLASERIGVLYFDGELNQPGVYSALEEVDKYYEANIYQQGQPPDGALYKKMLANGYSKEEIEFMVEAYNPKQWMNGAEVNRSTMKFRLGTVTDHWVKRAKMMRMRDVYTKTLNRGSNEDFIKQGQTFDEIGSTIMRLQLEANERGEVFTLRNVIDDIIQVEGDKPGGSLQDWKKKRNTVNIGGNNFALEDVKDFVQSFIHARTYEATATGVFGQKEIVKIGDSYYEIIPGFQPIDDEHKRDIIKSIKEQSLGLDQETQKNRMQTNKYIDQQIENLQKNLADNQTAYDNAPDDNAKAQLSNTILQRKSEIQNLLLKKNEINSNHSPEEIAKQYANSFNLIKVAKPDSIPKTVKDLLDADPDLASHTYRDFNAAISMKSPQGYGTKTLKPFQGLTKQKHNDMFGQFVQHNGEGGENNYSLVDYSGKMMNAVEDVIVERTKVLELYFAHQLLLKQAEKYKVKSSMLKERWVGIARFDQIMRWLVAAGFIASLIVSAGSLAIPGAAILTNAFISPGVVAYLLADIFFISNRLTKNAILWGDRKKNAIKAEEALFNQETQFEQALSNPAFSSTRGRLRLAQSVKSGEDILKSALLARKDVELPDNALQNSITGAYDWVKDVVT
jgi:hypothetical protein